MLPSDLYFFFETEDLSHASPLFLSQIGLVITQDSDVGWEDIYQKCKQGFIEKHKNLSEKLPHKLEIFQHFDDCEKEFLLPIIKALDSNDQINEW